MSEAEKLLIDIGSMVDGVRQVTMTAKIYGWRHDLVWARSRLAIIKKHFAPYAVALKRAKKGNNER